MEVSEVKQRLLTDFFTYYPMGGALYDKNGALIDINKSLNEKFPFTNEADFLLNNLFRTDLLTDLQKQYLRGGSVVSGSLPVPYSIIPSMNENREILGYTLLLTGNPASDAFLRACVLLRCRITRRCTNRQHSLGKNQRGVKIDHADVPGRCNHNIAGLNITMQDRRDL